MNTREKTAKLLSCATATDLQSREASRRVIEAIVPTILEHLEEPVEVDADPQVTELGFSVWLFAEHRSPHVWSGVLSGLLREEGGLNVGLVQFFFDARTQSRVRAEGGDYVTHVLRGDGQELRWKRVGWEPDVYGEWDDVPFPLEE